MATLEKYWEFAQLAQAAYVDLPTAFNEDVRSSLQNSTTANEYIFSVTQANRLISAEGFRVADISINLNDAFGFSATLFQDNRTGAYTLAIRGTEPVTLADIEHSMREIGLWGIAVHQTVSLYNYFQRLITPVSESVRQLVLEEMSLPPTDGRRYMTIPRLIPGPLPGPIDDLTYLAVDSYEIGNAIGILASIPNATLNVTGHSLGGHLAQALGRLFPNVVDTVYAHNTAGFYPGNADPFFHLLDPFIGQFDQSKIQYVYSYNGGEYIANDLLHTQYGQRVAVLIEDQTPTVTGNHSIVLQARSLALHALFEKIDPQFDEGDGTAVAAFPKIDALIRAGAPDHPSTYEASLKSLAKLFLNEDLSIEELTDLETFYAKLYAIRDVLGPDASSRTIESLTDKTANDLILAATNSDPTTTAAIAYRYALKALNPFAVTGGDYSMHNASGELEIYDPQERTGSLTQQWIDDRSVMLAGLIEINTVDRASVSGVSNTFSIEGSTNYVDLRHGLTLQGSFHGSGENVIFGGDFADVVQGASSVDRLYGTGGADYLEGKGGDDFLEGGAGRDVYQYSASEAGINRNDGADTILDTDGRGVLRYTYNGGSLISSDITETVIADASVKLSDTQWQSADGRFTYERQGADLLVTINDSAGGSIVLKRWQQGDFAIRLAEEQRSALPEAPITTRTITGDFALENAKAGKYRNSMERPEVSH